MRPTRHTWLPAVLLALLCLGLYAPSVPMGLVHFDDDVYLFEDARLGTLTGDAVWRIATEPFFANYHPVTTLTYAFDRAVWGDWIPGFRSTHLALYAAGVVLLFLLFRRLLGHDWAAFAAAAIYASHAVHVEAVAWLAQRKDVVCLVFYTATLLAYTVYVRSEHARRRGWYVATLALAAAAMLAKGYAVVLPAVLLAYDACFAQRLGRRHLLDKLPLVALSVGVTAATVASQREIAALVSSPFTIVERLRLLGEVFAVYVGKTLLPVDLSVLYVVGRDWQPKGIAALGYLLAGVSVAAFFALRRRVPAAAFGIALFLLPLATVMNVVLTLRIWIADRYLFFPTIGSSLLLATLALHAAERARRPRTARRRLAVAAASVVALYSVLTVGRIGVWSDPISLWSDAVRKQADLGGSGPVTADELARHPSSAVSRRLRTALAQAYGRRGDDAEARAILAGVERPRAAGETGTELALAQAAFDEGRHDEALRLARVTAEGGTWTAPRAWELIGKIHALRGEHDAARRAFQRAIELECDTGRPATRAHQDLALVELRAGNVDRAIELYRRVRDADPDNAEAAFGLGVAYREAGRPGDAVRQLEATLRLAPDHPQRDAILRTIDQLRSAAR